MEQNELYDSIDLTKPWDDPVNAAAFKKGIDVYQCPSNSDIDNRTTYLAIVTPDSCFRAANGIDPSAITDDTSQTVMVIEVELERAVPWMKPVDADEQAVLDVGANPSRSPHINGAQAVFADGSVQMLPAEMPAAQRRAMISIAGNDNAALEDVE
jgi:prepilin-type processing-associated H-X9-DG protein